MNNDLARTCRVCMNVNDEKMMSVFKVNISKKIMSCASVQVWPNDGLPHQICNKCSAKLHISFQFKKLCEKSDSHLRQFLLNNSKQSTNHEANEPSTTTAVTVQECQERPIERIYVKCAPLVLQQGTNTQSNFVALAAGSENETTQQITYNVQHGLETLTTIQSIIEVPSYENVYQMPTVNVEHLTLPAPQSQGDVLILHQSPQKSELSAQEIESNKMETAIIQDNIRKANENNKEMDLHSDEPLKDTTECKVCGKILSTLSKLNRHMNTHNKNKEHPFKCHVCSKGFSHSGNLKIHMRMHNDERPFKCTVCGQGSRQQQDLDKHMRTHTGERPHTCHLCPRAFTARSNLIAHIRTHTGERPYVCCVCQKAFCQSNELTKHMRTHTGEKSHVCNICNKGFTGSSSLRVHQRLHTGEKPYHCKVCEKSFAQTNTLKVHLKLHAVVNDNSASKFNCADCNILFPTINEFKTHLKITHQEKNV